MKKEILKIISIKDIVDSPWQGRLLHSGLDGISPEMEELLALSESIKKNGLMQPVIVRELDEKYELIDGHRRVMAAKLAGFGNLKAIIKDYDDQQSQLFSLIGNLQRKNLNLIEQALAFQKVLSNKMFLYNKELSRAIGKDETYVGDVINALKMDKRIIEDLVKNDTLRDVRLLRLIRKIEPTDTNQISDKQWHLYQKVVKEKLSRSQVQQLLKEEGPQSKKAIKAKQWVVKPGKKYIDIKLDWSKLNERKRQTLVKLLEEKLQDLMKGID